MDNGFKYQLTYMHGPINITVRLNTEKDVVPSVERLLEEARKSKHLNAKTPIDKQPDITDNQTCKDCGAKMTLSKKGNLYCTEKCWLKEED